MSKANFLTNVLTIGELNGLNALNLFVLSKERTPYDFKTFSDHYLLHCCCSLLGVKFKRRQRKDLDQSSDLDSASYLIGYQQMRSVIEQAGTHVNPDAFLLGTTDAIAGAESQVAPDKQELVLTALRDAITASNSEPGNVYRAENAKRPEVTTLPSGLQYEVIVAGDGPKPGLRTPYQLITTGV